MNRRLYAGGWYCDAVAQADLVLYPGSRLELNGSPVQLPSGQNVLYVRLSEDGTRFAGQGGGGAVDLRAMEWDGIRWTDRGYGYGSNPVIYDLAGDLHLPDSTTGSQGWRYVAADGRLVTADETIADINRRIWQWTEHGGITIGQGGSGAHGEDPLIALVNAERRRLSDGTCRNIHFRRYGDECVIAWWQQDQGMSAVLRCTVAELAEFPVDVEAPPPPPDIPPEPRSEFIRTGEIADMLVYVRGDPSLWPRGGDHAMDLWDYPDRECFQYQKFGVGAFETWTYGGKHHGDGSHREYYFTDGRWFQRYRWRIGEEYAITCETNQIQYYGEGCTLSTRGAFSYKTYLEGYYPRYWCGRDLGEREVVVFVYDNTRGITTDPGLHIERFYFARGAGWFRWEYIRADTGELENATQFYLVTGPRVPFAQRCRPLPAIVDNPTPPEPPMVPDDGLATVQRLVAELNPPHTIEGAFSVAYAVAEHYRNWTAAGETQPTPCGFVRAPQGGENVVERNGIWLRAGRVSFDGRTVKVLTDVPSTNGPTWSVDDLEPELFVPFAEIGTGGGGGGDEDDMTIDEHVQAMIDAATAPLVARIAVLEAGGGTIPAPLPADVVRYGDKLGLRSERTGNFIRNQRDRQEGHRLHADEGEDGRDRIGGIDETFTVQKA